MTIDELKSRIRGDHFALLGLPHRYAIDADLMKKNYLVLARATHPDFFAGDPEGLAEILALSAAVNDAYRTLEDPVRRAEYLLLAHGGKDAGQDKRVPPEMLGEVLMLNEEIADAKAASDSAALQAFRTQMADRRVNVLGEIETLATRLTGSGDPQSRGDPQLLDALRLELNAMKYVHNLLAQLA
jgi:molecular chaperone HscB